MFSISYLVYFFDIMDNTGKRFHAVIIHAVINAANALHIRCHFRIRDYILEAI